MSAAENANPNASDRTSAGSRSPAEMFEDRRAVDIDVHRPPLHTSHLEERQPAVGPSVRHRI